MKCGLNKKGLQVPLLEKKDLKKLEKANWWYNRTISCDGVQGNSN